jgi:hypothetical protein
MAPEAVLDLHVTEFSTNRLVEILREQTFVSGCDFQSVN